MTTISIAFEVDDIRTNIASAFTAALATTQIQGLGKPWVELPADVFFHVSTTRWSNGGPETVLEVLLRRYPEVAGVRVAGRDDRPLRPSIMELAPNWLLEKKSTMADELELASGYSAMLEKMRRHWIAQVKKLIEATPSGCFALFSTPVLEGEAMRFRLAYLPAKMFPTREKPLPGLDPALSWEAGPIRE